MSKNLAFIFLLVISLISCSSEEDCPVENIAGTYSGSYTEKYLFDEEEDSDFTESIQVSLENISGNTAKLKIEDVLELDIDVEGCGFKSEYRIEDFYMSFEVIGSFENDKLFIEMINPLQFPDTEEEVYAGLESLFNSDDFLGSSGPEIVVMLNELEGFSGFEAIEVFDQVVEISTEEQIEEFIDVMEYFMEPAESVRFDLTKTN